MSKDSLSELFFFFKFYFIFKLYITVNSELGVMLVQFNIGGDCEIAY